jgi:superfamily II DNA or RNA helicase
MSGMDMDFAKEENGIGWNGSDSGFGHFLAEAQMWKGRWAIAAYKMLAKYRNTQCPEYNEIPVPDGKDEYSLPDQEPLSIQDLQAQFITLPAKRIHTKAGERDLKTYDRVGQDFWALWKESKDELKELGFSVGKNKFGSWEICQWISVEEEVKQVLQDNANTPLDWEEWKKQNKSDIINDSILFDYQKEHAYKIQKALVNFGYALDGSGTGAGKTYCSLVTAKSMNLKVFVICPKAVIPGWERSMEKIGIEGYIVNYELIKTGKYRVETTTKKGLKKMVNVECPFISVEDNPRAKEKYQEKYIISWKLPSEYLLIFDEAHRTKNKGTINSQLITSAADQKVRILMLSATIAESPLKMFGSAKVLGFYDKPWEFYTKFAPAYGCSKDGYGWEYHGGNRVMEQLHREIYGAGKASRIAVEELIKLGKFPMNQIIPELMNLNGESDKYNELALQIRELEIKRDNSQAALSVRQKNRQIMELMKVPAIVEMTNDLIEEEKSVVIFVNYTQTVEALKEKLETDCSIYGQNSAEVNEKNRKKFEDNQSRVIICNVAASREGIDLHDIYHKYERVSLITPDDNAQNIKQVLGRIHRTGGTRAVQKILFVAHTIENEVFENVMSKISNIDALNDGDLSYDR